jgi:signal transduction histidine kinase
METNRATELRALILAPVGRDASLVLESLEHAGIAGCICASVDELARQAARGAGMCVVAEEALATSDLSRLRETLGRQPPWSDLPLLVVIRPETRLEQVLEMLGPVGNVTPLVRPFRIQTLVNTARTLLRARQRQYQSRDMMEQLAESDRRKTEFLALLGHELRNPLAAISVSVHLLERIPDREERARRALAVIDRQSRNLTRMVDDLLDVSRITSGKIVLRREPVDLAEVCEHVHHVLEPVARAAKVTVAISRPRAPVVVDGDAVRLEQIVSNLLGNAMKYTPEGGSVSLSVSRSGGSAVVRVQDDGIGIAQDMLGRIFKPFVQVHGVEGRSRGGLGLGLSLVRDLVAMHGGKVAAASAGPGRGSTFTVTLPLSTNNITAAGRDAAYAPARTGGGPPVLLVEDNPDLRELMVALIESWGYAVEVAEEGSAGVDLARRYAPRIALVDIGLPGIDGYEVARRVREVLPKGSTRLVAMSGFGQPEDRARALQAGFDAHLVKPVEPDDLRKLLSDAG